MKYDSFRHARHSIRLKGYDYRSSGAYFLTICTWQREPLFGTIAGGEMWLNELGAIVGEEWNRTPWVRKMVVLDELVIMPNHVHGIIWIAEADGRGMARHAPTERRFSHPISKSIPTIVGAFKSAATRRINELRGTPENPVWQRNYYERIIRDEPELYRIRRYIQDNPTNWKNDPENFIPYR